MADVTDDGVYVGECDQGHTIAVVLQHPKHVVLYQSGVVAFLYGFHREAVSSAAAALERFYEFCCRVFWHRLNGILKDVEPVWKLMAAQSERQFGAFLALHLAALGHAFPDKAFKLQRRTTFRNDVIHKGRIPTADQTKDYLRAVYEIAETTMNELLAKCPNSVKQVEMAAVHRAHKAARECGARAASSMGMPGMVLSRLAPASPRDFDSRLDATRSLLPFLVCSPQHS